MTATQTAPNGADNGSRIPALQAELSKAGLAVAEATAALKRAQHEQRAAQARLNAAVAQEAADAPLWSWARRSAGPTVADEPSGQKRPSLVEAARAAQERPREFLPADPERGKATATKVRELHAGDLDGWRLCPVTDLDLTIDQATHLLRRSIANVGQLADLFLANPDHAAIPEWDEVTENDVRDQVMQAAADDDSVDISQLPDEGASEQAAEPGACRHCGADRSGPSAEAHDSDCPEAAAADGPLDDDPSEQDANVELDQAALLIVRLASSGVDVDTLLRSPEALKLAASAAEHHSGDAVTLQRVRVARDLIAAHHIFGRQAASVTDPIQADRDRSALAERLIDQGGKGSTTKPDPKDEAVQNEALKIALHSDKERWKNRCKEGMTDAALKEALGEELGYGGSCSWPGQLSLAYKGGKQPIVRFGTILHSDKTAPGLWGKTLLARVRKVMGIGLPDDAAPAKPAKKKPRKPKLPPIPPGSPAAKMIHELHTGEAAACKTCGHSHPAGTVCPPLPAEDKPGAAPDFESVPGDRTRRFEQLAAAPYYQGLPSTQQTAEAITDFRARQQSGDAEPSWERWSEWHLTLSAGKAAWTIEALWNPVNGHLYLWCVGHAPADRFVQPAARLGSLAEYAQSVAKLVFKKGRKKKGG